MSRAKSQFPVKPTIVIDTREKLANRLFLLIYKVMIRLLLIFSRRLTPGDYTILEMPDLVVLRKRKTAKELYGNFILKPDVFMRAVERMRQFKHKYIIIQQTYAEFLDPKKWTFIGSTQRRFQAMAAVESWLISLSQNEDIHFLFTGQKHAPRAAKKILIKTYEWERKRLMKKAKELDDAD